MGRKGATKADTIRTDPPRRGRPPMPARTSLAQWLRDRNQTTVDCAEGLAKIAPRLGLPATAAPRAKTLLDSVNARHWPHPVTILLVRHYTHGDVDVENWVRDLRHLWPFDDLGESRGRIDRRHA